MILTLRTQMREETTKRKKPSGVIIPSGVVSKVSSGVDIRPSQVRPRQVQPSEVSIRCRLPVPGLYVREQTMSNRCNHCNSHLRLSLPQVGEQDAVCTCTGCGRVFVLDGEDNSYDLPAIPGWASTRRSYVPEPMSAVRSN